MIEWILLGILLLMLFFGSLAQGTGDVNDQWSRVSWTGIGCGLIIAALAPNPWACLLIGCCSMGLVWRPPMSVGYREKMAQGLVLAGAYVLVAPLMRPWMVVPILGMMGLVGAVTGLWAIYTSFQPKDQGYQHEYWGGWLRIVDRDGGAPLAGQGNFNHAQAVGALSAAAGAGLVWLNHGWGWPLLVLSVVAVGLCTEGRMTGKWVCQGWLHLGWLGSTLLGLFIVSWTKSAGWAWCLWMGLAIGCLFYAHPWSPRKHWYDSGRFAIWNLALRDLWWTASQPTDPIKALEAAKAEREKMEALQAQAAVEGNAAVHNQMTLAKAQNDEQQRRWGVLAKQQAHLALTENERGLARRLWAQRLRVRVLGCGTGSWYPMTKWPAIMATGTLNEAQQRWEGMVYLSAHNEFVEVLFEQGLLGLSIACGFVVYGLMSTWGGGALGHAVLLPLLVLLSVCLTNFPFTLFAEVERPTPATPVQFVGSPALLVMSLMIVLMVEAVR